LVLIWAFFILFIFLVFSWKLFSYPYDWAEGEGLRIIYAQRFLNGEPIYGNNDLFPMLGNCYPPFYILWIALAIEGLGPQLLAGRIVAFLATLGVSILIAKALRKEVGGWIGPMVGAASYLAYPTLVPLSLVVSFDPLGVFLVVLAASILHSSRPNPTKLILAGISLVLAIYTKQTFIYGFLGLAAWLGVHRKWRDLALLSFVFVAGSVLIFFLLQVTTDGWFLRNVVMNNVHRQFSLIRIVGFGLSLSAEAPLLTILSLLGCFLYRDIHSLWRWLFLFSLCKALLIAANGAHYHYFLPWISISSIFAGATVDRILRQGSGSSRTSWLVGMGLTLGLCLNAYPGRPKGIWGWNALNYAPKSSHRQAMETIQGYIAWAPGDVYVDRLHALLLPKGDWLHVVETAHILDLWRAGKWDPSVMVEKIRSREFSLMCVSEQTLLPPPVVQEILRHYRILATLDIGTFEIARPRSCHILVPRE